MLTDKIRNTVAKHGLLKKGDSVICAVSGGADSVCLLHVMLKLKKEYDLKVYAANVNHLIRGAESDSDSRFVKMICAAADTECFYREFDVLKIAAEQKIGTEECGRNLRYAFFEELSQKLGGAKVATGHNLNDNAETVLFRLVRGSAAGGMKGISYKRGNIIRPLLDCKRSEIEDYLVKNSVTWVTDSTNLETLYARNKIRLEVMPALTRVNAAAAERIVSTAANISCDDAYLLKCAEDLLKDCTEDDYVDVKKLTGAPPPIKRRAAKILLQNWRVREITGEKIDAFLSFAEKESGKRFNIDGESFIRIQYGRLVRETEKPRQEFSAVMNIGDIFIHDFWKISIKAVDKPVKKGDNNIAVFDGEGLSGPFTVRYRSGGDRMRPLGLGGSKKVGDIFSDAGVPLSKRDFIPLIEKDGEILYVCGLRQSEMFRPAKSTEKFLVMEYSAKE